MIFKKSLLAAAVSALVLTACGGSSSGGEETNVEPTGFEFTATEMITNLTNDVIVVGYQNLNSEAADKDFLKIMFFP